jgi:hypothetical protein
MPETEAMNGVMYSSAIPVPVLEASEDFCAGKATEPAICASISQEGFTKGKTDDH